MSMTLLMWESTTTAGIQMKILRESGASPQTQRRLGVTALSQYAQQLLAILLSERTMIILLTMIARKAIYLVPDILGG